MAGGDETVGTITAGGGTFLSPRQGSLCKFIATGLASLALLVAGCASEPARPLSPMSAPQKGMSYAAWGAGLYSTTEADRSLENLAATGATWIALIVTGYQESVGSTSISRDRPETPTDSDLTHVIERAHRLGLRVMLKPHIDLSDDPAHWRGEIGTAFTGEAQWRAWIRSYGDFMDHYATLAQEAGADMLSVGTELTATEARDEDWRAMLSGVRRRFEGPITYASNWFPGPDSVPWWDAVDYIGVDAYFPLTGKDDPTVGELEQAWIEKGYVDALERVSQRFNKQVILTEIGYRSVDGANRAPWVFGTEVPIDLQEQADAYEAALAVLWGRPWLAGIYWWNWDVDPNKGGGEDDDFTPHNKPAEEVLKSYYQSR